MNYMKKHEYWFQILHGHKLIESFRKKWNRKLWKHKHFQDKEGNTYYTDLSSIWLWHPTPVLLPGKSHGWRSLVGCSLWGCEELDPAERPHFHFSLSCIGEINGNPLQCSCLENPRDGGAWWASVYGVTQSWTRLKWLSSSSSSRVQFESVSSIRVCLHWNCHLAWMTF